MAKKKQGPAKRPQPKADEFVFDDDTSNGGTLTFRCLEFSIISENDRWTESELELWRDIVAVLNDYFMPSYGEEE